MKISKNKNPLFNFEQLNTPKGAEKAIRDIVQVFTKAGDSVVPEDAQAQGAELAKIKTENGRKYRELTINFMDNQSVVLRVNETGDIYKVKIDGKETPITNQDDHKAAIDEIIKKLNTGRVKHQALLAKRANPTPKSGAPRSATTTTKKKQIEQLTVQRDELRAQVDTVDGKIKAMRDEMGVNGSGKNSDSGQVKIKDYASEIQQKRDQYDAYKESILNSDEYKNIRNLSTSVEQQLAYKAINEKLTAKSNSTDSDIAKLELEEKLNNGYVIKKTINDVAQAEIPASEISDDDIRKMSYALKFAMPTVTYNPPKWAETKKVLLRRLDKIEADDREKNKEKIAKQLKDEEEAWNGAPEDWR